MNNNIYFLFISFKFESLKTDDLTYSTYSYLCISKNK